MARTKTPMPTDEQLAAAGESLKALAAKKKATSPAEKIWEKLGDMIREARKQKHTWDEIAAALSAGGVSITATALRSSQPKTARQKRPAKPGEVGGSDDAK